MSLIDLFEEVPLSPEDELLRLHTPPLDVRQIPAESVGERDFDVAVIGAGPAGSTAALHLAAAGYRVFLADGAAFPRNKTCGDGLVRDSEECLGRAGLRQWLDDTAFCAAYLSLTSRKGTTASGAAVTRTIQRKVLDARLAAEAVDRGAVFARGKVSALVREGNGVALVFEETKARIRAGYAVMATGTSFELALRSNLARRTPVYGAAIRCYVRSKLESKTARVIFCGAKSPGYGWVFPMGMGLFNVGVGHASGAHRAGRINLRSEVVNFLDLLPEARELLFAADARSPWQGHALRCAFGGVPAILGERILAAGEVMGTTFPFSGEGVGKAMESAELAASAIGLALETKDPARLKIYPQEIDSKLRPKYKGYLLAEKWFASPLRGELFIGLAKKSGTLRRKVESVIDETADPGKVFSAGGMLRALLGK